MTNKSGKPLRLDAATERLVARMWREWVRPYRGKLMLSFLLMAVVAAATGAYPLLIAPDSWTVRPSSVITGLLPKG